MTKRKKHWRASLFFILFSGALVCVTRPASAQVNFEQYEVVTGAAQRQTILTGFLLDGAVAELAAVTLDEDERRLRIYAFEGGAWTPRLDATLRPGVSFVDVAEIGGRDRLVTYEPGRLNWFDPQSATEQILLAATSNFDPPRKDEIPDVDITRDLNGDGRDDLVVPDSDGFWVFTQIDGGAFADPVKVGPQTDLSGIYGADGYRYDPWSESRVHQVDYNQDGRVDLVFWNRDRFAVHLQDEDGQFAPSAHIFTTNVAFDSDNPHSLAGGDMKGRVLHSLTDLSGDGIADLVVHSLQGRRISRKRSTYEVHFGSPAPAGGTIFAAGVDLAFQSHNRIQLGMDRQDFDRDGRLDLMITTIELRFLESSLWKRIKGFMGHDVWLDLAFYRNQGGFHPDTPDAIRRIALDGPPSHREPGSVPLDVVLRGARHERRKTQEIWPRAFNCTLLFGDVSGDGRDDMIIGSHPWELAVFAGVPGPGLFAERPQTVKVPVPNDEEYTRLVDLNKDGKQDVLLHHPFTLRDAHGAPTGAPGSEPHRVTMLIAR